MQKRGISAVVATVLLILITLVAVTLIWTSVLPMVRESAQVEERADLTISNLEGYTAYDGDIPGSCVQVRRGNDESKLRGIQFTFDFNGNSLSKKVYSIPGVNQLRTYCFNLTGREKMSSVAIAPIFENNKIGSVSSTQKDFVDGDLSGVSIEFASLDVDEVPVDTPRNEEPVLTCTDADSDGYNASKTGCGVADCDDSNGAIKPGAIEVCTGNVDDDCDGLIDCVDSDCTSTCVQKINFDNSLVSLWRMDDVTDYFGRNNGEIAGGVCGGDFVGDAVLCSDYASTDAGCNSLSPSCSWYYDSDSEIGTCLGSINSCSGISVDSCTGSFEQYGCSLIPSYSIVDGKIGKAINLSNKTYLGVPDSNNLEGMNQLTLSAWVYPRDSSVLQQGIVAKQGVYYFYYSNGLGVYLYNSSSTGSGHKISSQSLPLNNWSFVTLTYDGAATSNNIKFYLNGSLINSTNWKSGTLATSYSELRIGSYPSSQYFNGLMDEVAIYNKTLNSTEILALYHSKY